MAIRHLLIASAAVAFAIPAMAQEGSGAVAAAPLVTVGQTVRDANAARLGPIERVNKDGSVQIIYQQRLLLIPASTITVSDGKVSTSMTKKDLGKL